MLKVKFVEPHIKYPVIQEHVGFNLGLLSTASYALSNLGNEISVSYLSLRLNRICGKNDDIETEISKNTPDIVGVSAMTCDFLDAINVIRTAKEFGAKTVLGGIFPSLNYVEIMKNYPEVDIIVRGEGESSFYEILKSEIEGFPISDVLGITYRNHNNVAISNKNRSFLGLKEIPVSKYHLMPIENFHELRIPCSVFTSRGCSYNCLFCSLRDMWEGIYRTRPISNVVEELRLLGKSYGFKRVKLVDEVITSDPERLKFLLTTVKQQGINLNFRINSRLDLLNKELLEDLYELGVDQVLFGVDSISNELLQSMGKFQASTNLSESWKDKALRIVKEAVGIGYTLFPTFMLGWPGETQSTLIKTAEFAINIGKNDNVIPYLSFITPHPGSQLHALSPNLGLKILTSDLRRYTHLFPVAVPISLGENGLNLLVKTYDSIAQGTNSREWNPEIDGEYLDIFKN